MKYRIAAVSVLCLVLGLVLTCKVHGFVARSAMDEAELQAGTTLRLAVSALDGHLKRYEALPALTADDEIIEVLIEDPGNEALQLDANRYLKSVNALLKSSDIYIMTMDGTTIAASNYDSPVSFVGENFSYRPYFQEAARGERSRFFAVGTTSAKRGYYFSSPIVMDGKILGVIVFKVDLDTIEASWAGGDDRIFVSDPEGIIFMTGSDEWRFAAILPLTPDRIARTETSRRYADVKLHQLPLSYGSFAGHETMLIRNGNAEREYLYVSQSMPEAGWTVNVLMDTASVRWQAQTMMAAVFLALCLAGLVSAIVFQRRARMTERMQLQAEAQNELERRVDERTAALARVNSRIEKEIAERRLTERRLRKTQADLVQAGKLAGLGQMSAALSHELNQPLAAAKTYAETTGLLIERGRVEDASDNLKRISALIDRMASISRHLRNFARKPNEKLGAVSVEDVIRDTIEIVSARLKAADAELSITIEPGLPRVMAGAVRLQQVLVNIVTNAADAVEGLGDRRIDVSASGAAEKVMIIVRDRGPGVPAAIRERIFDPFFTTKGVGKGLGLGLSISYNIVKDFGGSLSVTDHPEGGAVFAIELDVADASVMEAAE
ncbi:sensor histidine kinase [Aliirhizobium cellulosilyticum]|uniref:C4-dicarboxylate transport sensor protein n=1 Tax=Aliirhizobium cellulosilyticum TaxID=393664 RepID=A0A7W6S3I8_9HYPH|nr:two-component system C4-dicarboxylate transport sensor histidine kinase DctB [Rhizobium cellulosilyticum]MBB4411099.1 two-component system C4-dicarboxylate transport sensor histidine kinase DctB [Rhizobium cellulosilyticum]MBB4445788.1 two-component system C4-dicarboxylate transport sensor histidine kinase DctB [Rhizobium cellulosilyticum]